MTSTLVVIVVIQSIQGWEILYCEVLEKDWKEKIDEFSKHARGKREVNAVQNICI